MRRERTERGMTLEEGGGARGETLGRILLRRWRRIWKIYGEGGRGGEGGSDASGFPPVVKEERRGEGRGGERQWQNARHTHALVSRADNFVVYNL